MICRSISVEYGDSRLTQISVYCNKTGLLIDNACVLADGKIYIDGGKILSNSNASLVAMLNDTAKSISENSILISRLGCCLPYRMAMREINWVDLVLRQIVMPRV